jgi:hypothetical protein
MPLSRRDTYSALHRCPRSSTRNHQSIRSIEQWLGNPLVRHHVARRGVKNPEHTLLQVDLVPRVAGCIAALLLLTIRAIEIARERVVEATLFDDDLDRRISGPAKDERFTRGTCDFKVLSYHSKPKKPAM